MRPGRLRLLLILDAAGVAAAGATLVVAAGLPAAARGGLGARQLLAIAAGVAAGVLLAGGLLLLRTVGKPVDRILGAAEALGAGTGGAFPLLGPPGEESGHGLSRAAVAFERLAAALAEERRRLADKVDELERANAALVSARESLLHAERLATAGTLASGIAHEVGNPLGAITGYVELARARLRAGQHAEADDFLVRIGVEAARIDAIVRGLLELARPAPPALGPTDVRAAVEDAVRLARMQARFRDVDVEVDLDGAPERVVAEALRLSQVLLNLLVNAGDAMGGRGRVRISARQAGAPGEERGVELCVADGGPGIPAADLPRLFEPFFTTKEPGRGIGLGLAVCQGIVTSFGGRISAENAAGGGAVFRVELRAWPGR
ncbi:MAG TPA: ATP-binding protein [Anaeromyxobacter sp.]|nr:ATP-binding protein [Anaeromyxobacter sp.]